MKGRKIVAFDMKANRPDDEELLAHMLGPTGHLRAPVIRAGRLVLVGFNDEVYREML